MKRMTEWAREALQNRRRALVALHGRVRDGEESAHESRRLEPDWPDRAADLELETTLDALAEAERKELIEIDAALRRIDEGIYGRCTSCGRGIGFARLRAIPEAAHCLSCATAEAERRAS